MGDAVRFCHEAKAFEGIRVFGISALGSKEQPAGLAPKTRPRFNSTFRIDSESALLASTFNFNTPATGIETECSRPWPWPFPFELNPASTEAVILGGISGGGARRKVQQETPVAIMWSRAGKHILPGPRELRCLTLPVAHC